MIFSPTGFSDSQSMASLAQQIEANKQAINSLDCYWWKVRAVTANATITQQDTADGTSLYGRYANDKDGSRVYYFNSFMDDCTDDDSYRYATIKYSSSVAINSSRDGVVLVNPSTRAINELDNSSEMQSLLAGKYVQGLFPNTDVIYYVPAESTVYDDYFVGRENHRFFGYVRVSDTNLHSTHLLKIGAIQTTAFESWHYVSSTNKNAYPTGTIGTTKTQNGSEYMYLGSTKDVLMAFTPAYSATEVELTSASWSNNKFSLDIPHRRFLLWVGSTSNVSSNWNPGCFLLVNHGYAYGVCCDSSSSGVYFVRGQSLKDVGVGMFHVDSVTDIAGRTIISLSPQSGRYTGMISYYAIE